jgi:hypothetical protein
MKKNKQCVFLVLILISIVLMSSCNTEPNPIMLKYSISTDRAYPGYISGSTITQVVPPATDLSILVASFTITGAKVRIGASEQVSGVTVNDFSDTNSQVYTVEMADGRTRDYTVTVKTGSYTTLKYDNDTLRIGKGIDEGGYLEPGVWFPESVMSAYAGGCIVQEEIYIVQIPSSLSLKLYDEFTVDYNGDYFGRQIYSKAETPAIGWNTFALDTPVSIPILMVTYSDILQVLLGGN